MQVHCADSTYIPMARGFVYLAVVLDWATRRVLSWRLSITMEAAFCVETLEDALARHGRPDIFTPIRARNLPARPSPACSPSTASPSAWTAKGLGGTMCSSNGCGAASNMRRSICELTKPSARRELRLAGISTSTTADVHIRVLTAAPQIKPTSTRCHSAWQPKPGRDSTYRRGDFVQTTGTSSDPRSTPLTRGRRRSTVYAANARRTTADSICSAAGVNREPV